MINNDLTDLWIITKSQIMKNFKLSFIAFMVLAFAKAEFSQAQQNFKATATYQTKMIMKQSETADDSTNVKDKLSPELKEAFKKARANAGQAEFTLSFTPTESIYKKVQQLAKPKPQSSGISVTIMGGGSTYRTTYKNLSEGYFKREDNIMGKEFLIKDDLEQYNWNVTGETKQIGNYTVIKAILIPKELTAKEKEELEKQKEEELKDTKKTGLFSMMVEDNKETIAWFTPQIPISNGPGEFHGLPGLILEVKDGITVILCTKVEINPEKFKINEPDSGKKITLEKFNKLQKKKSEEQMQRFKSGNGW